LRPPSLQKPLPPVERSAVARQPTKACPKPPLSNSRACNAIGVRIHLWRPLLGFRFSSFFFSFRLFRFLKFFPKVLLSSASFVLLAECLVSPPAQSSSSTWPRSLRSSSFLAFFSSRPMRPETLQFCFSHRAYYVDFTCPEAASSYLSFSFLARLSTTDAALLLLLRFVEDLFVCRI